MGAERGGKSTGRIVEGFLEKVALEGGLAGRIGPELANLVFEDGM